MSGTLFVVATPIGNLEDLSFRALRTLKEVDLIVAEDTRRTAKLLAHYAVTTPVVSLHAHNEVRSIPGLIDTLRAGRSLALVSDAGTPAIADPGEHLVRAAHQHGIRVSPIPGPNAIAAALSASGLPADEFVFMGFVPRAGTERRSWLVRLQHEARTAVFFEVPHRIARTLEELGPLFVERPIFIHRELTKIHEELVKLPNNTLLRAQGEFVIVAGPARAARVSTDETPIPTDTVDTAVRMLACLRHDPAFDKVSALVLTAKALGVDQRALAKASKKADILAKQHKTNLP
jgi:16S rRNA (cytidine1402-2'-O)-methyltransferase